MSLPDPRSEFLERFLDAAERAAAALARPGDDAARREIAARILLRRLFLRFAHEAPFARDWVGTVSGATPDAEAVAGSFLQEIERRFRFRLSEAEAPGDTSSVGVLAPDILAEAHAVARLGRHRDGVFYTPVGEVRLICREALRARLAPALGREDHDPLLLGVLYGGESKSPPPDAAGALYRVLASLRVCDPAAGCGALLLGMAYEVERILVALGHLLPSDVVRRIIAEALPDPLSSSAIRRHVAGAILFGLDIDGGAIEVARERLLLFALAAQDSRPPDALLMESIRAHLRVGDGLAPPAESQPVQLSLFSPEAEPPAGPAGPAGLVGQSPWKSAFAPVLAGPAPGFDVVVTNPPYVRQELLDADTKAGAQRACQALLPTDTRFDGKSDLYAFFFHLGLGLLREGGSLCVISSNSWLDVGFGGPLRSLLLGHARILAVIESAREATFADARVNPAIAVARRERPGARPDAPVRFVRLRGSLGDPRDLEEMALLCGTDGFLSTPLFRVVPVSQAALSEDTGGNWGGRYLRAPDLYHEMLDCCGSRLCRLDALASPRFGIKTGANDFFYLEDASEPGAAPGDTLLCRNGVGHVQPLERRYLRPVLRSPRELGTPVLLPETVSAFLLVCPDSREALAGSALARYVALGESAWGIPDRPSVRARSEWYQVPLISPPPVIHPLIAFERACAAVNPTGILCDANLVGLYPRAGVEPGPLAACLASSLGVMMRELAGIANLGQGALKTNPAYLARMLVPDLRAADASAMAALRDAFEGVRRLSFPSLLRGEPEAPWLALDQAVLSLLGPGAPDGARLRAVAREMVAARLAKARTRPSILSS